jgi:hypothetical protein
MVTLVPPPLGAAEALADEDSELELFAELDALDDGDDLSPDEQPDRPATTIAAPPTATSNPRFTTALLLSVRPVKISRSS